MIPKVDFLSLQEETEARSGQVFPEACQLEEAHIVGIRTHVSLPQGSAQHKGYQHVNCPSVPPLHTSNSPLIS